MTSAIAHAYTSKSPMVCFFGQHPVLGEKRWALQEGYGVETVKWCTKSAERVVDPGMVAFFMKKAFRGAMTYPYGPAAAEIPLVVLNLNPIDTSQLVGWTPEWRKEREPLRAADPELVKKCVDLILEAERPLLVVGEGIHWTDASAELRRFVELVKVPVHTRRISWGHTGDAPPACWRRVPGLLSPRRGPHSYH